MARNITRKRIDGTHVNAQAGPSNIASSALSETGELKTSEQMGERRKALLAEKQAELEQVLDKHDDNIRELFHLDHFISLLHYDPKVAKKDHSAVFEEWRLKYDPFMNTSGAGPSRTTRRAQQERIAVLKSHSQESTYVPQAISAPAGRSINGIPPQSLPSVSAALPTSFSGRKKAGKQTKAKPGADAKGKQKGRVSDEEPSAEHDISESISGAWRTKGKGKGRLKENLSIPRPRPSRSYSVVSDAAIRAEGDAVLDNQMLRGKRSFKVPDIPRKTLGGEMFPPTEAEETGARRKGFGPSAQKPSSSVSGFHITLPASPSKKSAISETRPTTSGKTVPGAKHPADGEPPASRPVIKRIRLIVREPPPTLSSPRQKPPPPQFNKDLSAFLSSYRHVDGVDYDERGFERSVMHKARLLKRIDALRKEGRLLLDPDTALAFSGRDEPGSRALSSSANSSTHRPNDLWSIIVSEAITKRNSLSRHRFGHGGAVASSIESKLRTYYNLQKTQGQREAAAEEKRVRTLAKSTSRLVLAEWRKAVFHVREEERIRREKEEKRLGKQHLDAILDQSGQILEKQQMDLHRIDVLRDISRSVSVSAGGDDDDDEDDEDDEQETEVEDNEMDDGEVGHVEEHEGPNVDFGEDGTRETVLDDAESVASSESEDAVGLSALLVDMPGKPLGFASNLSEPQSTCVGAGSRAPSDADSQADTALIDDMDIDEGIEEFRDDEYGMNAYSPMQLESSPDESDQGNPSSLIASLPVDLYRLSLQVAQQASPLIHKAESGSVGISEELECAATHTAAFLSRATSPPTSPPRINFANGNSVANKLEINHSAVHLTVNSIVQNGHVKDPSNVIDDEGHAEARTHTNGFALPTSSISPQHSPDISLQISKQNATQTSTDVLDLPDEDAEITTMQTAEDDRDDHSAGKSEALQNGKVELRKAREHETVWEPPSTLQSYAVARVDWHPEDKIKPPVLLRGTLRPYQQSGLEWLAALHNNNMNGILADEMGLGKTIQTIALLAHLACDRGVWGPHLIIVPTSVLLNWEMEFKKFLPGFKILSYHGTSKRRKELRKGWNDKFAFNVCVTSYTLASRDEHILKRKPWYYMILDEAHMIKNFKSQRWNILLMFKSFRRLLLTGTPLQNNLTELWALLQFLMSGTKFANLKEFGEWFSNPLEKAIEQGNVLDQEVQQRVMKLHTVLRPYLLRRLKRDVEKELPSKYEHLVLCRLSKRQRFLYDEFMSRNQTREDLKSGVYQKIANILMQLRKVCNHPNLFEVRPIVTSFAMERSAIAKFEIKELLVRRMLMNDEDRTSRLDIDLLGLQFAHRQGTSLIASQSVRSLKHPLFSELQKAYPGEPPPHDLRTIEGFHRYRAYQQRSADYFRLSHMSYLNALRCDQRPVYGRETIDIVRKLYTPLTAECEAQLRSSVSPFLSLVKSYAVRSEECADIIDKFAFATPAAVALDLPSIALRGMPEELLQPSNANFADILHKPAVKLQIAFPDLSLLQYDCGKLQELARLLQERKAGGHRVLIFTQMTRILDILEVFLNFHGYLYLRLDGSTKIEDRQYITERFNVDERVFAFIASSRSGGVGINLTGADTVIFYDSDFNPQMDRQCEDRAHRIGQIRDVHIFRFVSQYTVEEAMLRKANQKRSLDELVIQQGGFDWRNFFNADDEAPAALEIQKALVEFEDFEDVQAAKVAASEEAAIAGEDQADFADPDTPTEQFGTSIEQSIGTAGRDEEPVEEARMEEDEGGTTIDYMLSFVRSDLEYFREWKL